MKQEYKRQLIKDCVKAGVSWVVLGAVFGAGLGFFGGVLLKLMGYRGSLDWRWLSSMFSAISIQAILIKSLFAIIIIGWFALLVIFIKDIVEYKTA